MYSRLKKLFSRAGHRLYIVGGWVRDRCLGLSSPGDMDLCTDAVPGDVRSVLEQAGYSVLEMGLEFGTLTARDRSTGEMCEITTLRTGERYHPGSRHPKVTFGTDIIDDLARRDFTVNAMALDETGSLIDPHRGLDDLKRKLLRTPGDPRVSFREDPLRILRAFRFMATLGFSLEENTGKAVSSLAAELANVAAERKLKEMNLLLSAPGDSLPQTLNAMLEAGVLLHLLPGLSGVAGLRGVSQGRHHLLDPWEHTLEVVRNTPPDPLLRWAALFHDSGKAGTYRTNESGVPRFHRHEETGAEIALSTAEAMRFSRAWRKAMAFLVRNHMRPVLYHNGWSDGAVRRLVTGAGENLERLLALARADNLSKASETALEGGEKLRELENRIEGFVKADRLLRKGTGSALQAGLGLRGKKLGAAVARLEDAVLSGELPVEPEFEECVRFLESSAGESRKPEP